MSQKPQKATADEKNKRKRKKKSKQTITRAVTPIRLIEANPGKLDVVDQLVEAYLALTGRYVTFFCTVVEPNKYAEPIFETSLSERWHRVAIQQAAGIAQSWRTNRENARQAYLEDLADYAEAKAKAEAVGSTLDPKRKEPIWKEWNPPTLRRPSIQANANVVVVEKSADSTFDYWLRISTLDKGHPLHIPVKLAPYHQKALLGRTINSSTALHKRKGVWWLTLSFDEDVPRHTEPSAPCVGVDVGIANFLTTSTGKHYGSFHGKLRERQKRDREKRPCSRCHFVDRANRLDQKTFKCLVCGHVDHADHSSSLNLADRIADQELAACTNRAEVKNILLQRHDAWQKQHRVFVVCPPVQLSLWENSEASTDVG